MYFISGKIPQMTQISSFCVFGGVFVQRLKTTASRRRCFRMFSTSHSQHSTRGAVEIHENGAVESKEYYTGLKHKKQHNSMTQQQEKLETLMRSMEVLLREVEQLREHCGHYNLELSRHITELRLENRLLTEKYNALNKELQEALEIIEDLQDTKYALDAKKRQAEKLNRQL